MFEMRMVINNFNECGGMACARIVDRGLELFEVFGRVNVSESKLSYCFHHKSQHNVLLVGTFVD